MSERCKYSGICHSASCWLPSRQANKPDKQCIRNLEMVLKREREELAETEFVLSQLRKNVEE